jgi:hypothetical protein
MVQWNRSRRTLDLFGYANDLPLSGGAPARFLHMALRIDIDLGSRLADICGFALSIIAM